MQKISHASHGINFNCKFLYSFDCFKEIIFKVLNLEYMIS